MKISWTIKKKRGNFRPSLNYHICLEPYEKELAVHAVRIKSLIPEIPKPQLSSCPPLTNERHPSWVPASFHTINVPYFKNGEISEFIRLPFRESGEYPEVEASFKLLRQKYEKVVKAVYSHEPIDEQKMLDVTAQTRTQIASEVAAKKLLCIWSTPDAA